MSNEELAVRAEHILIELIDRGNTDLEQARLSIQEFKHYCINLRMMKESLYGEGRSIGKLPGAK